MMHWHGVMDFLAMGGYAFYVWGSVVVTAVLMAVEPVLVRLRRRQALARLKTEVAARRLNEAAS